MESMEDSSFCVDTSVLVDNLRGRSETVDFLRRLEESGANLFTTSVNSFELYYGAYRSAKRERNITAARALLKRLIVLELTEEGSEEAGRILSILEAKGERVDFRDVLIGAIAKLHKTTLITRDTEHFKRIPDLNIKQVP
jgi:predicted nucleic acid-binding protein